MEPRFYLVNFNKKTWTEFLDSGGKVYGTNRNKFNKAKKILPGDFFICYLSKISKIVGILEVKSKMYHDEKIIWKDSTFPVRFDVEINSLLDIEKGIEIGEILNDLLIFSDLKNPKNWGGFFINSFNEFPPEDGYFLFDLIRKKQKAH